MDDLHDAIENARYEECISEVAERKIPSPILPWGFPDEETLHAWKEQVMEEYEDQKSSAHMKLSGQDGESSSTGSITSRMLLMEPFTLEWTLSDSIGFFLFCTYVWDMTISEFVLIGENQVEASSRISRRNPSEATTEADNNVNDESTLRRSHIRIPNISNHSIHEDSLIASKYSRGIAKSLSKRITDFADTSRKDVANLSGGIAPFEARYAQIKFLIDVIRFQRVVAQVANGDNAARYVLHVKVQHLMDRYITSSTYKGRKNLDHLGKDFDDIARLPHKRRISLGSGENVDQEALVGVFGIEDLSDVEFRSELRNSKVKGVSSRRNLNQGKRKENEELTNSDNATVVQTCCLGIGGKPLSTTIEAVKRGAPYTADLFDKIEGYVVAQLKQLYWDSFKNSTAYTRFLNFLWFREKKVIEEDFIPIRKLGRGGFGLVHACKKGTSGKLYAMKAMHKKRVKLKKAEKLILNERLVLASVDSPFVVNLKYAFQSRDNIFLILDLMTGGDLSFHLAQRGRFLFEEARYYACCIMLGIQALHNKNFVYRDLKPENILMGDDGRIKITDMGLACKVTAGLHGACGTRGYWAPEMLRRDANGKRMSYGHTVDWFSFGCMLAEFISGVNPFRSEKALTFGFDKGQHTKVSFRYWK